MIYLYLTKRDKRDMKLVTLFTGNCPTAMKVDNLEALDLPPAWRQELERIVAADRSHYDLWMESAVDVMDLQKRLKARGFKDLPIITGPMVWLTSIPTETESKRVGRFVRGNYAPPLCPIATKKMHLAHERLRRVTP